MNASPACLGCKAEQALPSLQRREAFARGFRKGAKSPLRVGVASALPRVRRGVNGKKTSSGIERTERFQGQQLFDISTCYF